MPDTPASRLADGIRYLRAGSLDRAWACFDGAAGIEDSRIRSEALRRMADVKRRRAEWEDALRLSAQSHQVAVEHGLKEEGAAALNIEGTIHLQRGEFEQAVETYRQALAIGPSAHQRGLICQNLGTAFAQEGKHSEAAEWYAQSSSAFRIAGRRREEVLALINQGNVLLDHGELADAEARFREARALIEDQVGQDAELRGLIDMNLAEALGRQGIELDQATDLVLSATGHFAVSANRPFLVACHRVVALVSEARGDVDTAIGALERGLALAKEIGSGPELSHFHREIARLRSLEPR
ncbi:MAG: tetratricopeptide repeat protein [Gemmatimonas sp.]|nr:tetratricopeptide repeat protein [Gemmatimonas sp.]